MIDLAYAMGPAPQSGGGFAAVLPQLVPIVLVLGIFFFLVIRPQQRERRNREQDAATWVRLGAMLLRAGRRDAAIDALKQGLWLHRIRRDQRRADVVSRLIAHAAGERAA